MTNRYVWRKKLTGCVMGAVALAIAAAGPASVTYFAANGQAVAHENLRIISATNLPGLQRLPLPGVNVEAMQSSCSLALISAPFGHCWGGDPSGRVSYFDPTGGLLAARGVNVSWTEK